MAVWKLLVKSFSVKCVVKFIENVELSFSIFFVFVFESYLKHYYYYFINV